MGAKINFRFGRMDLGRRLIDFGIYAGGSVYTAGTGLQYLINGNYKTAGMSALASLILGIVAYKRGRRISDEYGR